MGAVRLANWNLFMEGLRVQPQQQTGFKYTF
jgi:hypothetical protein